MPKRKQEDSVDGESRPRKSPRRPKDINGPSERSSNVDKSLSPANSHSTSNKKPMRSTKRNLLSISEEHGDLFSAPPDTLLVHACNCRGYWGKGIAATFKKRYPTAFEICNKHCNTTEKAKLPGSALLIPPQDDGDGKHFVGNLFTSRSIGRSKDPKDIILKNTRPAMTDLLRQVAEHNRTGKAAKVKQIWMCKINSGIFGVDWEETLEVLKGLEAPEGDVPSEVTVMVHE